MPTYLLYGEDTFSSRRKLQEIKSRFFDTHMGEINITTLEGENLTLDQIKRAAFVAPFLAQKRLIIIKNFLNKGKEEVKEQLAKSLDKIPDFAIVVFYEEGNVNKSSPLLKKLNVPKKSQEFPLLTQSALANWFLKEFKERGGKIEAPALQRLVQITGSDLWRASLEIDKLISYKKGGTVKKEDVELLVKEEIHPSIFALIDALGERNIKRATTLLSELLSLGENESYILSMIAYQIRNLLIVKDLLEKEKPLSLSGLHPFVLNKTKSQAKNFTQAQLKEIYYKLLETDLNIKTGQLKPHLALDLLVAEVCK